MRSRRALLTQDSGTPGVYTLRTGGGCARAASGRPQAGTRLSRTQTHASPRTSSPQHQEKITTRFVVFIMVA